MGDLQDAYLVEGERSCVDLLTTSDLSVAACPMHTRRMPRFLIEVPHDSDTVTCARAVQVFLATGSHFLTNADWGCRDGDHRAIIFAEAANHDEARMIVPVAFRSAAKVVRVGKFTMQQIERTLREHNAL